MPDNVTRCSAKPLEQRSNDVDPMHFKAMKRAEHITQLPAKTEELASLHAEVNKWVPGAIIMWSSLPFVDT